jgi:hypothetical protein
MKELIAWFITALVLAALGLAALNWGRLEQDLARTEQRVAALDTTNADGVLARAERFYSSVARVPFIGREPLNRIRAERASLRYWNHEYAAIVPEGMDPIGALAPDNLELQLIVANAIYRRVESALNDPGARIAALDAASAAQLAVLKNSARNEDAAFNYEYLTRLRATPVRKSVSGASAFDTVLPERNFHGNPGNPPPEGIQQDFKVHVPLEPTELADDADEGDDAGKAGPPRRRG